MQRFIEQKLKSGERLNPEEGLYLLTQAPFAWLGQLAMEVRFKKNPARQVTYVVDTNPNTTNVCETGCRFCAFYRPASHPESYVLSVDDLMRKIEAAVQRGVRTVLVQGGHNRNLPLDYYLSLVRETKKRFPQVTPHFFSAPEIDFMSQVARVPVSDVLSRLKEAGQTTLPGGGAEILSDGVRQAVSPKKGNSEAWLRVHREAHRLGFLTTATMMFGHLETSENIIEHFEKIRALQAESLTSRRGGSFTAFIPWSFKAANTALANKPHAPSGSVRYVRILATSRLYLDNFPHIQASWFSEGKSTGQMTLLFGADDFGGTVFEENVHREAGFMNQTTIKEIQRLIHESGFDAVERDTRYGLLQSFPIPETSKSCLEPCGQGSGVSQA